MEFHDLEVFLAVAKERSFSKAARSVLRTQPAVSLAIRRLEEELETPLFDRSNKEPALTEGGKILREYAERLLNLRSEIRPVFSELQDLRRGRIRIGANETGAIFLLPYISSFRKAYPEIKVEVIRTYSREVPEKLLRRNIELAVLTYQPRETNLISKTIHKDPIILVVHPKHALAKKRKVSIKDLGKEVFAAHGIRTPNRERVMRTFQRHGVPLRLDVELPTIEAIRRFVQMGQASALIPRQSVEWELKRGDLIEVPVAEIRIERKFRLIYRKGDSLSHAAQEFARQVNIKKN